MSETKRVSVLLYRSLSRPLTQLQCLDSAREHDHDHDTGRVRRKVKVKLPLCRTHCSLRRERVWGEWIYRSTLIDLGTSWR
jgi:hypothetical protein